MDATELNIEQCWSIANFLRTAAEQYGKLAELARTPPALNESLAEQFDKQQTEARAYATLLENSSGACVFEE